MRIVLLALILLFPLKTLAGEVEVRAGSGPMLHKRVISFKEARFKRIVAQETEFSCGAAALATILNYHFGQRVTENEIVEEMKKGGDQEQMRKKGFSLLDIKKYAEKKGYKTGGFKLGIENIGNVQPPAIVLINTRNYSHFTVLKKVVDNDVLLADPALGNRVMSLKEFARAWNNIVLLIDGPKTGDPPGLSLEARKKPLGDSWRMQGIDLGFLKNPAEF